MFPVSSNAETAEKILCGFRKKRHKKGRLYNAPIDGIAKHRTGNASRNGHIKDMVIMLAAAPGVEKIWRFFYGTAAKDLLKSSTFDFSIFCRVSFLQKVAVA